MAKKRNRKGNREVSTPNTFANPRLVSRPVLLASPLSLLEDRRLYHPEQDYRPARSFGGPAVFTSINQPNVNKARSTKSGRSPLHQTKAVIGFSDPQRVAVCVRRESRREVLFAKRLTRSGKGSNKRRNWFSDISCK